EPGSPRLRMEALGNGARSEVLPPHREGPKAHGSRGGELAALDRGDRADHRRKGRSLVTWLGRLLRRARLEKELDRELSDHLERQVADYVKAGMPRRRRVAAPSSSSAASTGPRSTAGTPAAPAISTTSRRTCATAFASFAGVLPSLSSRSHPSPSGSGRTPPSSPWWTA